MIEIKRDKCVICHKEKEYTYYKFCDECYNDEIKLKKYQEGLEKRRKYAKGELITSLDEMFKEEFIYFHDKIYHRGWFQSWTIRMAEAYIRREVMFKAVRKIKTPPQGVDIDYHNELTN